MITSIQNHTKYSTISPIEFESTKIALSARQSSKVLSQKTVLIKTSFFQHPHKSIITINNPLSSAPKSKILSLIPKTSAAFYSSNKKFFDFNKDNIGHFDTIVYDLKDSKYLIFMYGGIILTVTFLILSWQVSQFKDLTTNLVEDHEAPWFYKSIVSLMQYNYILSGILFFCAAGMFTMTLFRPSQAVRSMTLLKGGKNVKMVTWSPISFGQWRTFEVPLRHISLETSRLNDQQGGTCFTMKVKDRKMDLLLEKNGEFPHPELFDKVIGLKRSW